MLSPLSLKNPRESAIRINGEFSKVAEYVISLQKLTVLAFPCGTEDSNLPANAGDTSSILGPRRFHMPWNNQDPEPQLLSLHVATTEACVSRF